jgi:Protein of unknown function (DUF3551)
MVGEWLAREYKGPVAVVVISSNGRRVVPSPGDAPAAFQCGIRITMPPTWLRSGVPWRAAMRPTILFLIAAALLGEIQAASAQSPTSYPWCSRYTGRGMGGVTSCYFTSYEQCRTTVLGIGGYCFRSPYYHSAPAKATPQPRRHRAPI